MLSVDPIEVIGVHDRIIADWESAPSRVSGCMEPREPHPSESDPQSAVGDLLRLERPLPTAETRERARHASILALERQRMTRFRRMAIATLASGIFLTAGGVSVAVTALNGPKGNAAQAVYPNPAPIAPTAPDSGGVLGDTTEPGADGGEGGSGGPGDEGGQVLGDREAGSDQPAEEDGPVLGERNAGSVGADDDEGLNVARQAEATGGDDRLPFTGLVTIPLLLVGAAMSLIGAALLRRVRQPPSR